MNRSHHSFGFSMIEVLVTIVLICIGVLGMVALQGRTIAYTQDAVQRNTAAILADDLLEMMRADLDNVLSDGLPKASSSYYKGIGGDFPDAPSDCSSLATLSAGNRLGCWAQTVKASLPGAGSLMTDEYHICRTKTSGECTGTGSTIEIQLAWTVKGDECLDPNSDSDDVCHYRVRVEF